MLGRLRLRQNRRLIKKKALALAAGTAATILTFSSSSTAATFEPGPLLEPKDVPAIGVDTGRFNLPINCAISLPDAGGIKVFDLATSVHVQGVAGTRFGPGQKFYLTQGSGFIKFPTWLSQLAGIATVSSADATITELTIGATHSSPPEINVADPPQKIPNIPITPDKQLVVGLPVKGTFDVGPYTAPESGVVTLKFNRATAYVDLVSDTGIRVPLKAVCTPTAGNALLSVSVGGPHGQPPQKIHGAPLNFPPVEPGNLIGIINAPYTCRIADKEYEVGIAVGAEIPLAVGRDNSMMFSEASGALTVPAKTVNKLLDAGIHTVSGEVTKQDLKIKGGLPEVQNVAKDGIAIPETKLVRDQKLVMSLPANGTLTAGPFSPKPGSSKVAVSLGAAAAEFKFNGSAETIPATCAAPSPDVILVDAPVT